MLCLRNGIPLAHDLTLENMTDLQASAIDEIAERIYEAEMARQAKLQEQMNKCHQ